jgi:hypothetical protein
MSLGTLYHRSSLIAAALDNLDCHSLMYSGKADDVSDVTATGEYYDPTTSIWTNIAPMPRPRYYHTAVSIPPLNGIIILGGYHGDELYKDIDLYEPLHDRWSTLPYQLPDDASYNTAATYCDGLLYVIGAGYAWTLNIRAGDPMWVHLPLLAPHLHNCAIVVLP